MKSAAGMVMGGVTNAIVAPTVADVRDRKMFNFETVKEDEKYIVILRNCEVEIGRSDQEHAFQSDALIEGRQLANAYNLPLCIA